MNCFLLSAFLSIVANATAHMTLAYPPPLRSPDNPFSSPSTIDHDLNAPLHKDGSDYPCKGSLSLLGTEPATPVVSWVAGKSYNMTIHGGATHGGGSCQCSISIDSGKT